MGKKEKITLGILAHVDAGKTTLSEGFLYLAGKIKTLGRVDHGDSFLDSHEIERERGITVFSKQARLEYKERALTLVDTPGHIDFSPETERSLQILDYALLLLSRADGVNGQVRTLWKLLEKYGVPTFIYVNKMDQEGKSKEEVLEEVKSQLSASAIDFSREASVESQAEEMALADEAAMEEFFEKGTVQKETIIRLIGERKIFPCYFGSALKMWGVDFLLDGICEYASGKEYKEEFAARVFKISKDDKDKRLVHVKISGGSLRVREEVTYQEGKITEKISQIRLYEGDKYRTVQEVKAGEVCTLLGISKAMPGEGLGAEGKGMLPVLEPVLSYDLLLPEQIDAFRFFGQLKSFEEEEPQLQVRWEEELKKIQVKLMGEVQISVLKRLIWDRFHIQADFGEGSIVYKETIANSVEGVGHFEPLRHYAEVHLLMEPQERGSGISVDCRCQSQDLELHWQKLILSHIEERPIKGVLTGSEVTDIKITVVGGRGHQKHTEGGDFREATYRALRQGLCQAKTELLEPYYDFRLELPAQYLGRALSDFYSMAVETKDPQTEGDRVIIEGRGPVLTLQGYPAVVSSYSQGLGSFHMRFSGYDLCHNAEEVLENNHYDAASDTGYPTDSVFCSHGAGFIVPWYQVFSYMHVDFCTEVGRDLARREDQCPPKISDLSKGRRKEEPLDFKERQKRSLAGEIELKEIFARTYHAHANKERASYKKFKKEISFESGAEGVRTWNKKKKSGSWLLVDGYNIIFSWEDLKDLAEINIDGARESLVDILSDYSAYIEAKIILVFDAYKVKGFMGEVISMKNIDIVYTREAETADAYIEKVSHKMSKDYDITVATSDGLEQVIIRGAGCRLLSAKELKEEIAYIKKERQERYLQMQDRQERNYLFSNMEKSLADKLEEIRLGVKDGKKI